MHTEMTLGRCCDPGDLTPDRHYGENPPGKAPPKKQERNKDEDE